MQEDRLPANDEISDEELAVRAKEADSEALAALIVRYYAVATSLAKGYHVAGLEPDDLQQEALTGFIKALRSFDRSCEVPFRAYATLCMKRQMQTAVRVGLAGKQQPLRDYVPLDDSSELTLRLPGDRRTESPEAIVIMGEEIRIRRQMIQSLLSAFEREALDLYLSGHSYEEMSIRMKAAPKAVDNALQRVRRKLRSIKL